VGKPLSKAVPLSGHPKQRAIFVLILVSVVVVRNNNTFILF
jgi:hypothetical protein